MEHTVTFTNCTAAEIARIIARNQDNERLLKELLLQALTYERLLTSSNRTS